MERLEKEIEPINFEQKAAEITADGYLFHAREHDKGGRDPKTFHTSEHPRALERRAEQMADVLHLSFEQRALIKMAIAWHDTVIEYDQADPNNLLAMIGRHRGAREGDKPNGIEGNEGKSTRLLEGQMRNANEQAGTEIFTEAQISIGMLAVDSTYPDFKWAPFKEYSYYNLAIQRNSALAKLFSELNEQGITKGPLFFQPHLEKLLEEGQPVPREVLITALADLGGPGLAEKEEFFREGDNEMRELYANLRRPEVMQRLAKGDEEVDRADRGKITTAFIGWLDSQPSFALWQALRFEKIIYLLKRQNAVTSQEEQGLRSLFDHFIDNIHATLDRAKGLKKTTEDIKSSAGEKEAFLALVRSMHYEI